MITIDKLARLANVSKSTVSKALNNRPDVSLATKRKIQEIARRYNYVPVAYGRRLKDGETKNVGVIFTREKYPLSNNPFFSRILEGIEAELAINGYNLILNILQENSNDQLPAMIREKRVDGIILIGIFNDRFINALVSSDLHVVQVDPNRDIPKFSQVFIDNEHGAFLATQHLIKAGHQKIGFISGDLKRLSFSQRLDGYKKALKHYHLPYHEKLIRCYGIEEGYEQVKSLLNSSEPPTAIFSANDLNALTGYNAITDMNLSIPDDISMVGFDDIYTAKIAKPPLTTIRVYKEELGSIGVRSLLRTIQGELENSIHHIVPVKLVERKSVKNRAGYQDNFLKYKGK